MTLLSIIIIAISIGALYGVAYGFLALGVGMFVTLLAKAILRRIPLRQ